MNCPDTLSISIAAISGTDTFFRIGIRPLCANKISPDEEFEGGSEGVIRGRFLYHHHKDFEPTDTPDFQYAPYLLEALLQAGFLVSMTLADSERSL